MAGGGIDTGEVRGLLHAAARAGTALTYAEVLGALGFAFSRPKMRALCAALDDVDAPSAGRGGWRSPSSSSGRATALPGHGWWLGRRDYRRVVHRS